MENPLPTTIDEVLTELDRIIEESIANNDARGIFTYVYRRTTAEIKAALEAGEFSDNQSLHAFDVAFANFYLRAYHEFQEGKECSLVWMQSFNGCKDHLCIVQYILLGMNAHINLDLALTTALQSKGRNIQLLQADFLKVNAILSRIVNNLQDSLSRVSPLFFLLDWLGQNRDEKLIDFSMQKAREQAWNLAVELHTLDDFSFSAKQKAADETFALFAQKIRRPNSKLLNAVLAFIGRFEEKNVSRVIRKMEL